MKIDDLKRSRNVEDRRGQSSGGPRMRNSGLGGGFSRSSSGGIGGGMGGLLLQLLLSRGGGGKWVMLAILAFMLFGGGLNNLGGLGSLLGGSNYSTQTQYQTQSSSNSASTSEATDEEAEFLSKVLYTTEEYWSETFANEGLTYHAPTLVLYTDGTSTGCGFGSAQAGPFYCPADEKVYIDLSFYRELTTKYNATGDFAMAYVLAHEVGHHVQNELGTMSEYNNAIRTMSERNRNKMTVRLELQADYYAGAWANYVESQRLLEVGDIQEAMNAAHAVGDDTLQEQAYGRVVPDSFTHGSSAQRMAWFERGYKYGDLAHGDTFNTVID